jgi:hypothetical protein
VGIIPPLIFNKNKVMGLLDKITSQQPTQILGVSNQLTPEEIEVLLSLIKRSNFLGEDIEPLYNMVLKLQNQYLEQTK